MPDKEITPTDSDVVEAIYKAALNPLSYRQFADIWQDRIINVLLHEGAPSLEDHVKTYDLVRHFKRALEIFETSKLAEQQSIKSFLDACNYAAAITRLDGAVLASNAIFETLFNLKPGQSVFDLVEKLEPKAAVKASGKALNPHPGPDDQPMVVRRLLPDGKTVILIIESFSGHGFQNSRTEKVLFIKSCRAEWTPSGAQIIQNSFRLTNAELNILKELYRGLLSADIAIERNRAKGTVRKQIKTILNKTDTSSQVELISMITGILHVVDTIPNRQRQTRSIKWKGALFQETKIINLDNNRQIQYAHYGKKNGRPILFIHGHTSSSEPPGFLVQAIADKNLQIIAPCKPGVEQSTPDQGGLDVSRLIQDWIFILDDLGLDRLPIAGHCMSGVYAIHAAASHADRFSSVGLLDTGAPLIREEQFAQMPPGSRGIFWTVKESPDLAYAPFAFASEAFFSGEEGERLFMKNQFEESPRDAKLIETPEMYALACKSMADFMRLPKRSVDELRCWIDDWTGNLKLTASRMPVLFIHSQEHEWLPYRDIVALSDNLPNTEYIILDNASQLFVYNQPDHFAKSLRALVESAISHSA